MMGWLAPLVDADDSRGPFYIYALCPLLLLLALEHPVCSWSSYSSSSSVLVGGIKVLKRLPPMRLWIKTSNIGLDCFVNGSLSSSWFFFRGEKRNVGWIFKRVGWGTIIGFSQEICSMFSLLPAHTILPGRKRIVCGGPLIDSGLVFGVGWWSRISRTIEEAGGAEERESGASERDNFLKLWTRRTWTCIMYLWEAEGHA